MIFFRLYLFSGLVFHKAVWTVMKHRGQSGELPKAENHPPRVLLARLVKLVILVLISIQICSVDVLPILREPIALRIVGGLLYTLGLITAVLARIELGNSWSDIEVGDVPRHKQVVASGPYRYLRHPIYAGDLLLLVGLELSLNSWLVCAAVALIPPVVFRALQEERALFGALAGYEDYMHRTKGFIPFIV